MTALVDAHHHLWDTVSVHYELLERVPRLRGRFDAAAYKRATREAGVSASVCVEAASARADPELETSWLLAELARADWPIQLVAYAPLESPGAASYLDRLVALAGTRLVGVRRGFEHDGVAVMESKQTVHSLRLLGSLGLPFDVVVRAEMLPSVTRLAERCPGTTFVLDHMGKPLVAAKPSTSWRRDLAELASCGNVCCKISGLMTETDAPTRSPVAYAPFVGHAFEVFGRDRVLFGTDWPSSTLAGTIDDWLNIVKTVVPADAHENLLDRNARRIYKLNAG